jgi:hypothetical protein
MSSKFTNKSRLCPNCGKDIVYKYDVSFYRAKRKKSVCSDCRYKLYPPPNNTGRHLLEKTKIKISNSLKGIPPWNKGISLSDETKTKISNSCLGRIPWSKGKKFSIHYIKKLQDSHKGQISPMKGKKCSDETRYKIRMSILEGLKQKGIRCRGNLTACNFIDILNSVQGWNLQHANNGGEKQIYGYLLDGFDEHRGIIFEYDEPRHHLIANKKRDIQRQNDLFKYFKSINKPISFWRYDERYKNIYEVLP